MKCKRFACEKGLFQKVVTHKLCQNANFENWGNTFQTGILHVMLNILSTSSLSRVQESSDYYEMQKSSRIILRCEEN